MPCSCACATAIRTPPAQGDPGSTRTLSRLARLLRQSTPNPTALTRCCWPGCRCFIPTGCTRSRAWDREMRCGGRPSCTPPWPTVHSSPGTGARGSGSDRINSDACPAATRRALRAWARSTSIPLCAPTIPTHAEPDRRRGVSRARFWHPRAPADGLADKKYGPKRRPSCRPGR